MDLNERLRRIRNENRRPQGSEHPGAEALERLQELVAGEWYRSGGCQCYVTQERYAMDHVYGRTALGAVRTLDPDLWRPWLGQVGETDHFLEQALFIDAETTGLGTGPSTLAFMLGVAFYEANGFVVRQYMIPDPADEPAMLDLLLADMAAHPGLVSFNGKSFDWPLVRTRLILADRLPELDGMPHLDLLLMARRLWRNKLASCSLGSLETEVLGIERTEEDVPGWMIPGIYEDFRAQGKVEPLSGVFYHNQLDMVSMAALAIQIGRLVAAPFQEPGPLHDFYAIGRLYERAGQVEAAMRAYRRAWDDDTHCRALQALSSLLKRQGDLEQATVLWTEALDCAGTYPCIELAKHYEHCLHDYEQALGFAQSALDQLDAGAELDRQDIAHRIDRLRHKLNASQNLGQSRA